MYDGIQKKWISYDIKIPQKYRSIKNSCLTFEIKNKKNIKYLSVPYINIKKGKFSTSVKLPGGIFNEGEYKVRVFAMNHAKRIAYERFDAINFQVVGVDAPTERAAYFVPRLTWNIIPTD